MTTILHLDSSARQEGSVTRQLTAHAVELLVKSHPEAKVVYRDLARDPLPHLNGEFLGAMMSRTPTAEQTKILATSDALVDELKAADIIVIGAPMYNFNIPTQLKAWIDHICRAGKTFNYTATGAEGHLHGKKAIVAVGTGGVYTSGAMTSYDHVISYMRQVLGFVGITDVTIVTAEKQGMGSDAAAGEVATARASLDKTLAA